MRHNLQKRQNLQTNPAERIYLVRVNHCDRRGLFVCSILCFTPREVLAAGALGWHTGSVHIRLITR